MKLSRSTERKHAALEGEASSARINAVKCRNEFGQKPDVKIIACVSQQTDGWNNSPKGARVLGPDGEKEKKRNGPSAVGICYDGQLFPGLSIHFSI